MTPAYAVGVIVLLYWSYVVAKLIRVRRRSAWRAAAIPRQPLERVMWVVWIPLVVLWISLPFVSENQPPDRHPWLGIHASMATGAAMMVRWIAVLLAIASFVGSLACWRHMGSSWRMAVDDSMTTLLTSGPFRRVRHPIYSLSMLLMACTVVAAPNRLLFIVAAMHVCLLVAKAINEERFLRETHGHEYVEYAERTGRFLPRIIR